MTHLNSDHWSNRLKIFEGQIKGIQEIQASDKKTLETLKKALETLEEKQTTDYGESLEVRDMRKIRLFAIMWPFREIEP